MATAEDSQPEMYLNFYNAGQSKLLYVTDSISKQIFIIMNNIFGWL